METSLALSIDLTRRVLLVRKEDNIFQMCVNSGEELDKSLSETQ